MNRLNFTSVMDKNASPVEMNVGDALRVKNTVVEGGKTRIQTFEGVLISMRGRGENKTFTVRRVGNRGVGVERTWPVTSRSIVGIEVKKSTKKIRRSKLYFLRDIVGKMSSRV